jgi:hypothetical protein
MNFDVSRLRRADRIIGISAVAFFIFLFFFKWFGGSANSSVNGINFSASYNGWHTFHDLRWIWLITIIVALVAVAVSAGALSFKSPVQLSVDRPPRSAACRRSRSSTGSSTTRAVPSTATSPASTSPPRTASRSASGWG